MRQFVHTLLAVCLMAAGGMSATAQSVTAQEVIAKMEELVRQYAPQAPASTTVMDVATALYGAGDYARTASLLEQTIDIWGQYNESEIPHFVYHYLADCYLLTNQQMKALKPITKALTLREQLFGTNDSNYASTLELLGRYHYQGGQYAMADSIYRQAIAIFEQNKDFENMRYIATLNAMAVNCGKIGDQDNALLALAKVETVVREKFGENSLQYATVLSNQADTYDDLMNYSTAINLSQRAQHILESKGMAGTVEYSGVLGQQALSYEHMGQYDKAIDLYQKALKIDNQQGKTSKCYAVHHMNAGLCYGQMSNYSTAADHLREAANVFQQMYGTSHPYYQKSLKNLQFCLNELNAPPHKKKEDKPSKKRSDERAQQLADEMFSKGKSLYDMGKYTQALECYTQSKQAQMTLTDRDLPNYATTLHNMGLCHSKLGQYTEAISLLDSARLIRRDALGEEHRTMANTKSELGYCYLNLNQHRTAIEYYTQSKHVLEATGDTISDPYLSTLSNLAICYKETKDYGAAIQLGSKACDIFMRHDGRHTENYATMLHNLGSCWMFAGNYENALPILGQALEIMSELYGKNSPKLEFTLQNMFTCCDMTGRVDRAEQLRNKIYELTGAYPKSAHGLPKSPFIY